MQRTHFWASTAAGPPPLVELMAMLTKNFSVLQAERVVQKSEGESPHHTQPLKFNYGALSSALLKMAFKIKCYIEKKMKKVFSCFSKRK